MVPWEQVEVVRLDTLEQTRLGVVGEVFAFCSV